MKTKFTRTVLAAVGLNWLFQRKITPPPGPAPQVPFDNADRWRFLVFEFERPEVDRHLAALAELPWPAGRTRTRFTEEYHGWAVEIYGNDREHARLMQALFGVAYEA